MRGIIYRYIIENNKPVLNHWAVDFSDLPPDTVMTKQVAFQYFKTAQKKFRIPGKVFTLLIDGHVFMLGKTGKNFTIFELGDVNERNNAG